MGETVGIREFKARASELLRAVERGSEVTITVRGRPAARLLPVRTGMTNAEIDAWLKRTGALADEIGTRWPQGLSATQALSEDRSRLDRR